MIVDYQRSHVPPEDRLHVLDYSGSCENPWAMPLRARALWATAVKLDIYGKLPKGSVPFEDPSDWVDAPSGSALRLEAQAERVILRCGRCSACTWRRRKRWETAAIGFARTADLSIFGTLTFSNEWFARNWKARREHEVEVACENLERQPGFDVSDFTLEASFEELATAYDATNPDHFSAVRMWLTDERQRMLKRFRQALSRRKEFEGVKLIAHLELMELGDLRGRPHFHFLFHFECGGADRYLALRDLLKSQWHDDGLGVGFVDCKKVDGDYGEAGAAYVCKYIGKYIGADDARAYVAAETKIACSLAYLAKGRKLYADTLPSGECEPEDQGGPTPEQVLRDSELETALEGLGFSLPDTEMPYSLQKKALQLGRAVDAWNAGELWPGFDDGIPLPETMWRYYPPSVHDLFGWLTVNHGLGRFRYGNAFNSQYIPDKEL